MRLSLLNMFACCSISLSGCVRDDSYVDIEIRDTKTHAPIAETEIVTDSVCMICPLTTTPKDVKATTDEASVDEITV